MTTKSSWFALGISATAWIGSPHADVQASQEATFSTKVETPTLAARYCDLHFRVVGKSGAGFVSRDGRQWTPQVVVLATNWRSVCRGNNTIVAIGSDGQLRTSSDGCNWTLRASGVPSALHRVVFGNGRFVAIGNEGGAGNIGGWHRLDSSKLRDRRTIARCSLRCRPVCSRRLRRHDPDLARWSALATTFVGDCGPSAGCGLRERNLCGCGMARSHSHIANRIGVGTTPRGNDAAFASHLHRRRTGDALRQGVRFGAAVTPSFIDPLVDITRIRIRLGFDPGRSINCPARI